MKTAIAAILIVMWLVVLIRDVLPESIHPWILVIALGLLFWDFTRDSRTQ